MVKIGKQQFHAWDYGLRGDLNEYNLQLAVDQWIIDNPEKEVIYSKKIRTDTGTHVTVFYKYPNP